MPWVELPHSLIRPLLFAGLLHDDKLVLPQQVKSIIFINRKHQHKLCGVALGGWFVTGTTGFQSSLLGVRNGSYWFGFYRLLTCQTSLAKKQALELYRDRIELNCRHRAAKERDGQKQMSIWNSYALCKWTQGSHLSETAPHFVKIFGRVFSMLVSECGKRKTTV